jgi:DNA polymerase-3 subunit delta
MGQASTSAIDFLQQAKSCTIPPVCVVFGDDAFLKREVLAVVRRCVLGTEESEFSWDVLPGATSDTRDVFDLVSTMALFGKGRRLVQVDAADPFVTRWRGALEDYVARPVPSSVLVLEVTTWPSNTRLFKQLATAGLQIDCHKLGQPALRRWISVRARGAHEVGIDPDAVDMLLELVEPDLGIIDQQLATLAVSAGMPKSITARLVSETVGGWRARSAWELVDQIASGQAAVAIEQLDRLLRAGEQPIGLLAQIAFTLRRFATAHRLLEQAARQATHLPLHAALETAGFPKFVIGKATRQLKQLGPQRTRKIPDLLLQADMAMKGSSSAPHRARWVLECLIARLSTTADPRRTASHERTMSRLGAS